MAICHTIEPNGDQAVIITFSSENKRNHHDKIFLVHQYLERHPFDGMLEAVLGMRTLTIYYDVYAFHDTIKYQLTPFEQVKQILDQIIADIDTLEIKTHTKNVIIPVCYDKPFATDLASLAETHALCESELIERHCQADYLVYMLGFSPGFPYLGGLDRKLITPRKKTPSLNVAVGSVAIAHEYTGIYTVATPAGWHVIGRTPLKLFDPSKKIPALLQPGDTVNFKAITLGVFEEIYRQQWQQQIDDED
ncbi:MAG: 5-oxoprolinase subunit PxpB [Pseudomonadota bacterium]